MIEVFFYSIADKKQNQVIDDVIQTFLDSEFVPMQDKKVCKHCIETAKNGQYPSRDYFSTFYPVPAFVYKNLAEIVTYSQKTIDFYKTQYLQKEVLNIINDADNSTEFLDKLDKLSGSQDKVDADDAFEQFHPILYSESIQKPETKGMMVGVQEIDDTTNGLQEGSIASICAFTAHGKSTFTNSILFRNALAGKKCVLFSLEMAPSILWAEFQARYLYQQKSMQVNFQDILMHKLNKEQAALASSFDEDFLNDIGKNLMILDESVLTKPVVTNVKSLQKLFRKCEKQLGGLDLVAFDHIGQFELLYPDQGNAILKVIQSTIKTYQTETTATRPVCLWCCQCNRQGNQRAMKNGGIYDFQAIGDLNEVERSSTYVIFMYTADNDKINQETHLTLSKHRLGQCITEPITTTFNPGVITVGEAISKITVSDDEFNNLGNDFDFDISF